MQIERGNRRGATSLHPDAERVFRILKMRVQILKNTGVGAWDWHVTVWHEVQVVRVRIRINVIDRDTGQPAQVEFPYTAPPFVDRCDEAWLIEWFFTCCLDVVRHELMESFLVDGQLFRDPHANDRPLPADVQRRA